MIRTALTFALAPLLSALLLASSMQSKVLTGILPHATVAQGSALTEANFTAVGTYRMPASMPVHYVASGSGMTGGVVGGEDHLFFTQQNFPGFSEPAPAELRVPGSPSAVANWASATRLVCVQDWQITTAGCFGSYYAPFHGHFCDDYDLSTGAPKNLGGNLAGLAYNNGYFYAECGGTYGNYQPQWHWHSFLMTAPGNTTYYGPWRLCEGQNFDPDTSQSCGPRRSGFLIPCPAGMCDVASGGGGTQDSGTQYGDSIYSFTSWMTSSTDSTYGSTRGSSAYRTTDLLPTHEYVSHGNLTNTVSPTTGLITTGQSVFTATRRPPIHGAQPYYPEPSHPSESIVDPNAYGGSGTWVIDTDGIYGGAYVDVTNQAGFVQLWNLTTGIRWYRTTAGESNIITGTIFDRSVDDVMQTREAIWITNSGEVQPNARLVFYGIAANQHYTIALTNPGANHGSTTCAASGVAVTVSLKTDSGGAVVSNANDVIAAINNTSACSSLMVAGMYSGDGTGIATPFAAKLLAMGPYLSPTTAADCHIIVTGPCATDWDNFLAIYAPTDLEQTPPYLPQPSTIIRINDLASFRWFPQDFSGPNTNLLNHKPCGMWFSPLTHNLYLCAAKANTIDEDSLVHVIHVASTVPAPAPLTYGIWSWLFHLAPSLTSRVSHALAEIPSFFQEPR